MPWFRWWVEGAASDLSRKLNLATTLLKASRLTVIVET